MRHLWVWVTFLEAEEEADMNRLPELAKHSLSSGSYAYNRPQHSHLRRACLLCLCRSQEWNGEYQCCLGCAGLKKSWRKASPTENEWAMSSSFLTISSTDAFLTKSVWWPPWWPLYDHNWSSRALYPLCPDSYFVNVWELFAKALLALATVRRGHQRVICWRASDEGIIIFNWGLRWRLWGEGLPIGSHRGVICWKIKGKWSLRISIRPQSL